MSEPNYTAAYAVLLALAAVPAKDRVDVLAFVAKVVVEKPEWLPVIKGEAEKKPAQIALGVVRQLLGLGRAGE